MCWKSLIWAGVLALPGFAAASEAEMILDRRDGEVSIYFAMEAPLLENVFGQGAEALLGPDGTVDIDRLYDGTFFAADDIFQSVAVRVGGEEVRVEALSMMLHDPDYLPGFTDPIDGQVSIAVCTSPETVRGMTLPELRAYMGYYAWQVDGHAAVEIIFPETGRDDLTLTVRDYIDFAEVGERVVTVSDGGVIRFAPAAELSASPPLSRWLIAGAATMLLLVSGAWLFTRPGSRPIRDT